MSNENSPSGLNQDETKALVAMMHNLQKGGPPSQIEIDRAVAQATAPLIADMKKLRDDAERIARFATEDLERLANKVKEASEKQATETAKKLVRETLLGLGIDPDKPKDFINGMERARKFFEDVDAARKHAIFAFIGAVMLAVTAGFWQAIKAGILKP